MKKEIVEITLFAGTEENNIYSFDLEFLLETKIEKGQIKANPALQKIQNEKQEK
jgi:hypothetical protein